MEIVPSAYLHPRFQGLRDFQGPTEHLDLNSARRYVTGFASRIKRVEASKSPDLYLLAERGIAPFSSEMYKSWFS